jgi:hypothetical protein
VLRADVAGSVEGEREIGDEPAILEGVVQHDRVAEIVRVAQIPEMTLAHEVIEGERGQASTRDLVVDADRRVHGLDVVVRADVTVGVGRMTRSPIGEVEAIEVGDGGRSLHEWHEWRVLGVRR